jgi:penicillin V acylase-like amidase (Ntn superfamily)
MAVKEVFPLMIPQALTLFIACTSFLVESDAQVAVGKSYDWSIGQGVLLTNKRGVKKRALLFDPSDRPAEWISKHASLTFNQYGQEVPNGGINDAGLVLEIMWLETSVYPAKDERPAVNELQWIQYQLDNYASVAEVAAHADELRVAPAYARVHYLACDATSDCAAFEYVDGKLVVSDDARSLTNHTWAQSVRHLQASAMIPKSTSSLDRFVRATQLAGQSGGKPAVKRAFEILDSVRVPGYSKWNIVYEPKLRRVHYRTDRSKKIKTVALDAFAPECGTAVETIDLEARVEGEVTKRFTPWSHSANLRLVKASLATLKGGLPKGAAESIAAYPSSTTCTQ